MSINDPAIRITQVDNLLRTVVIWSAALLAGGTALAAGVQKAADAIPGQYIVVLKEAVAKAAPLGEADVAELADELAHQAGGVVLGTYHTALQGFAVNMSEAGADQLAEDPRVAYVAEDAWVTPASEQIDPPSWGLDRIDQRPTTLDSRYEYSSAGVGVHLYVLDSGVLATHVELAGRVDMVNAFNAAWDGHGLEDCFGHGTFVAAVAAGETYGAAKGATIHPVRVVDCNGVGQLSSLLNGIEWVTAHFQAPAVAMINLQMPASQAVDDALSSSTEAGVTYVVAAGNSAVDACDHSPGRAPSAITVGASNQNDVRASFSNYGPCVDLFAPGVGITSAWIGDDHAMMTMSGTSAAAPHVAGVAALYLAHRPTARPEEVAWALANAATPAVAEDGTGSTDLLLYSAFTGDTVDQPPFPTFTVSCSSGRRCTFNAADSADDGGIVNYSWDFGDGTSDEGRKRSRENHRYPHDGLVFEVTLIVTDTAGQSSTLVREVALPR